ncbi:MAG: 1-deoxy-D-xylulose-5-phosphate reductoisomerase [Clostridia bacterium]|nr:1-deoxy-D-xylulose-5-phosphate reductoisomerase [Clostridia bacterium]
MKKTIAVLGSTGSIGTQSLDVAARKGYRVDAIAAGRNVKLLEEQIRAFHPRFCGVSDEKAAKDLKIRVADTDTEILSGEEGICAIAGMTTADTVINSIVGRAGLRPTVSILEANKKLARANKESLVCAGDIVMKMAKERGLLPILPVDSEHSAIFQCLQAGRKEDVSKLILTASGGPFFGKKKEDLRGMTAKDALAHPTWSMGAKITIDSATLMNKGFEVMEAVHLFGVPVEKVDVVVHRESIVHSMVEYVDHSVIAQLATPDMRDCIQYAVTYPEREPSPVKPLDLATIGKLTFARPDRETFPLLDTACRCLEKGGVAGAVLNGANEGAVALFLAGKITFTEISEMVIRVVEEFEEIKDPTLEEIYMAGEEAERRLRALA